ncbi:hypothetical protein MMC18_003842 [Xylographa bjoerkii]|nr:hypothetical protein [Xylographa bjoerkii]
MSASILSTFAEDLQTSLPSIPLASSSSASPTPVGPSSFLFAPPLPMELCLSIVVYIVRGHPRYQSSLFALCLVSHIWYDAAITDLYYAPVLAGRNYQLFVRTLCPSINLHIRRSPVAPLVKILDLSKLVHEGSKSVTGRLLGRVKETLEAFIAPQTSFSVNALPALSKCTLLRQLDLSLISASLPVLDLLRTLSSLNSLDFLALPRCSPIPSPHMLQFQCNLPSLPHSLRHIRFACNLHPAYMPLFHQVPPQLTGLTITDGPGWYSNPVDKIIQKIDFQITALMLQFRLPKPGFILHDKRRIFPALRCLEVSADHLFGGFFSHTHHAPGPPLPLTDLTINGGAGAIDKAPTCEFLFNEIMRDNLETQTSEPGILFRLRRVRISSVLNWRSTKAARADFNELDGLLVALEREEMERSGVQITPEVESDIERRCGVREFQESGPEGHLR